MRKGSSGDRDLWETSVDHDLGMCSTSKHQSRHFLHVSMNEVNKKIDQMAL